MELTQEDLSAQGWYSPSGGTGPVAEMDGNANGWVSVGDQIPVGPHEGFGLKSWPIGEHPQMDYSEEVKDAPYPMGKEYVGGDDLLSLVRTWDTDWHAEAWGGTTGRG